MNKTGTHLKRIILAKLGLIWFSGFQVHMENWCFDALCLEVQKCISSDKKQVWKVFI